MKTFFYTEKIHNIYFIINKVWFKNICFGIPGYDTAMTISTSIKNEINFRYFDITMNFNELR